MRDVMCVVVVFVRKNHLRTLVQKLTFVFSRKRAHFIENMNIQKKRAHESSSERASDQYLAHNA